MPQSFAPAEPQDIAACSALLRGASRSFHAAALLLPRRMRDPATALYAFCRQADDAVDLGADPLAALQTLRARLDAAYAGCPWPNPVDRAFAATVAVFAIPKSLPEALIEGLAWDAAARRYDDFAALCDYAARVAGSVGVMMALILGVRNRPALARAADLGIAMQLTNIARDVGEDACAGRLYLPLDWLAEVGLQPDNILQAPRPMPALAQVVRRLLGEADLLYAQARPGIAMLPWQARPGIGAAHRIYAAIGREVAKNGYDSVSQRARVTGQHKLRHAAGATLGSFARCVNTAAATHPANLFLISDAACENALKPAGLTGLIMLFDRLERAQRGMTA